MFLYAIFFAVLLLGSLVFNYVLLKRGLDAADRIIEYENFVSIMQNQVGYVVSEMNRIDESGAFEADDEVGDTFRSLHLIVESLSNFTAKEQNGKEENIGSAH